MYVPEPEVVETGKGYPGGRDVASTVWIKVSKVKGANFGKNVDGIIKERRRGDQNNVIYSRDI